MTTTTTKRKLTILKQAALLIGATILLSGCTLRIGTITTTETTTPDKIEYNINQDRFTALEFCQWAVDTEPTVEEMEYFLSNRMTSHEASKVIEAANRGMTAQEYIEANR